MIRFMTLVLSGSILLALFFIQPVSAQQQEYACECKKHMAGARGPSPCSIAETNSYCEITYGVPPVLVPRDKENLAKKLSALTDKLRPLGAEGGVSTLVLRLSYDDERVVHDIPPFFWENPSVGRGNIVAYIISVSVFPLIYQNEPDSIIGDVGATLLRNMPFILKFIGRKESTSITPNLTVGSGCIEAFISERRILFNSGWYAKLFHEGWSCSWAGKKR